MEVFDPLSAFLLYKVSTFWEFLTLRPQIADGICEGPLIRCKYLNCWDYKSSPSRFIILATLCRPFVVMTLIILNFWFILFPQNLWIISFLYISNRTNTERVSFILIWHRFVSSNWYLIHYLSFYGFISTTSAAWKATIKICM